MVGAEPRLPEVEVAGRADLDTISKALQSSGTPLRASEIARKVGLTRSEVNAVLHAHMDTIFRKNTDDFTWTIRGKTRSTQSPKKIETSSIRVEPHFAPEGDPIGALCCILDDARREILVQAYYLRSGRVAKALIRAKERGLSVRLLLGCTSKYRKSNRDVQSRHGGAKDSVAQALHEAGIEVLEDYGDTNNHNKCAVIDGCVIVTGGLNFCERAAENADNMIVIRSTVIAKQFAMDWAKNRRFAEPFKEDLA